MFPKKKFVFGRLSTNILYTSILHILLFFSSWILFFFLLFLLFLENTHSCDSTFSSIIVFNQISWVDDVDEDDKKEEEEESSSSSSSSKKKQKKKSKKSKKLPKLETAILGEIQTKFDLRSYIKKTDKDDDDVIVIE